jgi:hypothetical protein
VGEDEAVALADLLGQLQGRLVLGHGVVPRSRGEALDGEEDLVAREGPADAELLAEPAAGHQGRPGVLQPVQLEEDVAPGHVQRVAVPLPAGALVGEPGGVVDDPHRLPEVAPELADDGQTGEGQAGGRMVADRGRRRSCLLRRGGRAVEVAE